MGILHSLEKLKVIRLPEISIAGNIRVMKPQKADHSAENGRVQPRSKLQNIQKEHELALLRLHG